MIALRCLILLTVFVGVAAQSTAPAAEFAVSVAGTGTNLAHVPLKVGVHLDHVDSRTVRLEYEGEVVWGQLAKPSILARAADTNNWELHFVMPHVPARETVRLVGRTVKHCDAEEFVWTDHKGLHQTLSLGSRPMMRYMYEPLDRSTPERLGETYKVYHHVFDPTGVRLVTKGPGGRFPHHRGLFYGFNRISYSGKTADIWHCRKGEHQSHAQFLAHETGPVLGRHQMAINWHGQDDEVFAEEQRELAVFNLPEGILIEFASLLRSVAGPVRLDGDPQHAGFQFRGSQDIPDHTAHLTYYLRPDGKAAPGEFRNWKSPEKARGNVPGEEDLRHINLPWNAMSFVLDDQRYTCCYIDHPQNPKPARFSERDYGRFGSYFEYDLDQHHPLRLSYRIWLQRGEMTVKQADTLSQHFVAGPIARAETLTTN